MAIVIARRGLKLESIMLKIEEEEVDGTRPRKDTYGLSHHQLHDRVNITANQ